MSAGELDSLRARVRGRYALERELGRGRMLLQETRTAASLSPLNIVPVHAVEEYDDLLAFTTGSSRERVLRTALLGVGFHPEPPALRSVAGWCEHCAANDRRADLRSAAASSFGQATTGRAWPRRASFRAETPLPPATALPPATPVPITSWRRVSTMRHVSRSKAAYPESRHQRTLPRTASAVAARDVAGGPLVPRRIEDLSRVAYLDQFAHQHEARAV